MGRFDSQFDRLTNSRWAYAAIAGLVFLLSLPGLFALPVLDRDEGRFTEASSEMMETGDFVVIRYHEELRNKKPVAIHWFQSMAVSLTSGAHERNIWDYRIPSMLGAVMAALATFWGGLALFTRRAAFIGAVVMGTTLLLTTEANIGKTDAALVGFMTLGLAALAHIRAGATSKRLSILFWACLSIGVLLKGPIAPLVVAGTIVALFVWERRISWARPLLYWGGISLFVVMTVPWYVAVQIATNGAFLSEAVAVDLGPKLIEGAEGHDGPFGMHTAALPVLFWPGTILLVPGLWLAITSLRRNRQTDQGGELSAARAASAAAAEEREASAWRFVVCWLVPSWLVFEITPTKLVHYVMPMYPALALMAGAAADRWFSTNSWDRGRWISVGLFAVVAVLYAIAPTPWVLGELRADAAGDFGENAARVAGIWEDAWNATGIGFWPTILILLASGATVYAVVKKHTVGLIAGIVACSAIAGIGYRAVVLPNQAWMLPTGASLSALREVCALPEGTSAWDDSGCEGRAPKVIRAIAYAEPSFVFELGNKVILPPDSDAVIPPIAEDNRPAWLINTGEEAGRTALGQLIDSAVAADRCVRLSRRFVLNYSNGDPSELVAAVVEPAGCPDSSDPPSLRPTTEDEEPPVLDQ
jgi:4-amino-4-deoxy-L-arabinose transferase-like glycosyltransferase